MNAYIHLLGLLTVTFFLIIPTAHRAALGIVEWLSDYTDTYRIVA